MSAKADMTIFIIHHSHTDVGYTDTQEKMRAHHVGFIREAMLIAQRDPDFVWNCEGLWGVEQFLCDATEIEQKRFAALCTSGRICVSGSYLNLTDLAGERVINETLDRVFARLAALGITVKSAMTADVNGYGWGLSDALYGHGVRGLYSCIHTHHGYYPLKRKQTPFYWITPKGERLLTWNGDHYLLGNELGFAQASEFEYTLQDGLSYGGFTPFDKAVRRIEAYVRVLKEDGYEYDFVPVSVSGNMTDNSPASPLIPEFIRRYNALNTGITLKMTTTDELFARAAELPGIPEYAGDFTDWWADGIGSTPADVKQYRDAQRKYEVARRLDPECKIVKKEDAESALYNLMFYAEHTWGYSSSITEPCHPQVNNLDQWKRLYALKASESAVKMTERLKAHYGETPVSLCGELKFRAVNPHDAPLKSMLIVDLEHFYGHRNFIVTDEKTGESVPFQISRYSRGPELCIHLDLKSRETKTFALTEQPEPPLPSAGLFAKRGIEGVADLYHVLESERPSGYAYTDGIENDFFKIVFEAGKGVTSIFDKRTGRELIAPEDGEAAFTPVYETTPRDTGEDYLFVRRNLGRNRKAVRTIRSRGKVVDIKILENGPLFARAELKYALEGMTDVSVVLTAFKKFPRIRADFRLNKQSVWEPENVYLSLPFARRDAHLYMDKAGAAFRPRTDQLPFTCADFYAVQNGAAVVDGRGSLLVGCPDAPLLWMGGLEAHSIRLSGEGPRNADKLYGWVMNNFWETNFKASLGGFYQFSYLLESVGETEGAAAMRRLERINEDALTFYLFEPNGESAK